jgi:hypothetical protein
MARPATMARERLKRVPGALASPWIFSTDLEPVAAPAAEVAARLGVTVEEVHGCGVDPYWRVDGEPVLSIHLVGVALGLRRAGWIVSGSVNAPAAPDGVPPPGSRRRRADMDALERRSPALALGPPGRA